MTRARTRVSHLPLRLRLVAGFSLATFVVLLAAGTFVYWRVDYALDRGLDTDLTQASTTLDSLIGTDGQIANTTAAEATGVAWQVLAPDGTVLDRGGPAGEESMPASVRLDQIGRSPLTVNVGDLLPASLEPYRLRIARSTTSPYYLSVGVRRDQRDEALRELLLQLGLAGLGALIITALVGERLARAALAPVERYRRRAAAIAAGRSDLRLDVPTRRNDEITRLGHTFNDMLSSLEAALDRERQFVNDASHELRTPITLLTSRVQLALRRPRTRAEHEQVLAELEIDLERLAQLAGQLLQVGGLEEDTGSSVCDARAVVSRMIEDRRPLGQGPGDAPQLTLPADPLWTRIADVDLERVLTNLLDNAARHGAPPCTVVLDHPSPAWARLRVSDSGPGMSPALLEIATQRFARAAEARNKPGSGLGLFLVATLVALAGGEIRLCHHGQHTSHARPVPVDCSHDSTMTVTVLLPATPASI